MVRLLAAAVASLLAGIVGLPAAMADAHAAPLPGDCKLTPGGSITKTPWPQTRLSYQSFHAASSVTQGKSVKTGAPVVVAVADSGLNRQHPQLAGMNVGTGIDAVPKQQGHSVTDCNGHGSAVTSIIAAQPDPAVAFVGIAPDVKIVPIRVTNDANVTSDALIRAIDDAVAVKASVLNLSLAGTTPSPGLLSAVKRAAAHNLVIVAAGGNDGQSSDLPAYPAAYSTQAPNVIAVAATNAADGVPDFSTTGNYITVAAPGADVVTAAPFRGYVAKQSGTSYAAPYVTGTVALIRAAHPDLSPEEVRNRIIATADPPPATVPDARYGYGVIDPYLAITSVRDDTGVAATPARPAPVPAPAAVASPDRQLAHRALAVGAALLGLTVLAVAGALVLRGSTRGVRSPEARSQA